MGQTDSYRHKGLRKKLVDSIRDKGIVSEDVLDAVGRVARHLFMDSSFINFSYTDKAFPIARSNHLPALHRGLSNRIA